MGIFSLFAPAATAVSAIGGMGGGGGLFGPQTGNALQGGFGQGLATSLLGTGKTRQQSDTASGFDMRMLPHFEAQLAKTDASSANLGEQITGLSGQRRDLLQAALDRQLAAVEGYGQQELDDISRQEQAAFGGISQGLANRGFMGANTLAQSGKALARREANIARGRARERQQAVVGGMLGQHAQLMDRLNAFEQQAQMNRVFGDHGLRTLIPQQMAQSTRQQSTTKQKNKGWLSSLFG